MARQRNTDAGGRSFSQATINAVWNKAQVIPGVDANTARRDRCGARIHKASYGQTTEYGWEIDHDKPVSKGGGDELGNLQPLHWENNRHKGDDWPSSNCAKRL